MAVKQGNTTYKSASSKQTKAIARNIALNFRGGEIVLLYGEIGAGKTQFAKGIAKGLGINGIVTSPTFTLMQVYEGRLKMYHCDMYRINDENELFETGFFEELGDKNGIFVIEWPQNIAKALPEEVIKIDINITGKNNREITVT